MADDFFEGLRYISCTQASELTVLYKKIASGLPNDTTLCYNNRTRTSLRENAAMSIITEGGMNPVTKSSEITIESVKSVVRQLVEQLWPHQINAFEMSFGQLTSWPHHWQHIEPTKWKVEDLLVEMTASSGYAFPGTIPEETSPWLRLILVLDAVAEHFRRLGKVPEDDEIEAEYKNFGSLCELPQEAFDVGKPAAIKFVQSYFRAGATPFSPAVGYVVYEGQKRHTFSEENKLEKFRARKKTYDIYVDDLTSEILVKGKKPNLLAGETSSFLLLKCLLRRVGNHWTHDDLFKELGMVYTKDDKVILQTGSRALLHRMLDLIRKSFNPLAGKTKVDKWFDSRNPKRIVVASDLNSCLIESLS